MLKLVLLYTGSMGFPLGDAYTNRVLSIGKGLIAAGCQIKLLIIYPGRKSGVLTRAGIFDSISYEYLTQKETSNNFVKKKIIGLWGIIHCVYKIIFKLKNTDAIVSFSGSTIQNTPISFFSKLTGVKFIREVNEYPQLVIKKGSTCLTPAENKKIKRSLKNYDGLICISRKLSDYFKINHSFERPVLIVPITVDTERFNNVNNSSFEKYITYGGNLYGEKDGIDILVKAFKKISQKHPDFNLQLIGDISNTTEFKKLQTRINELHLKDRVCFTGYLERDVMPFFLCKSAILALARPNNIQAQGGFPTKLGEYLATGKPVVVTSVGDIPEYIKDSVNGFLAEPGSVDSFAEKLDYVINNYDKASEIGLKGKELVDFIFDAAVQGKRISEFVLNLKRNN